MRAVGLHACLENGRRAEGPGTCARPHHFCLFGEQERGGPNGPLTPVWRDRRGEPPPCGNSNGVGDMARRGGGGKSCERSGWCCALGRLGVVNVMAILAICLPPSLFVEMVVAARW